MITSPMPHDFQHSYSVIKKYLEHHVPGISVAMVGKPGTIKAQHGGNQVIIPCSQEDLDDLEEALTNSTFSAKYINGLVRDVTLRALVSVGKKGMAPEVSVSKLVVDEELDWSRVVSVATSFDGETANKLYEGLKVLDAFAVELTNSDVPVPEIESEHEAMATIVAYYEKKGHLDSPDASASVAPCRTRLRSTPTI